MICSTVYPFSAVSLGTSSSLTEPTARMHDCGGLIYISERWSASYDSRKMFDRLKHAKIRDGECTTRKFLGFQSGVSRRKKKETDFPSRAFLPRTLISSLMLRMPLLWTPLTIGVIKPASVATAI
jgi:hypothetical protein